MRPAPATTLRTVAAALVAVASFAVATPPVTSVATAATDQVQQVAATRSTDEVLTARAAAAAQAVRAAARQEPLFPRQTYLAAARQAASALAWSLPVVAPPDDAPSSYVGGVASAADLDSAVAAATGAVVAAADAVLRYPLHTDGGWAVVTRPLDGGRVAYGVAVVVGWAAPPVAANSGCATLAGWCWSTRGLNPHLPWTRNQVKWYLSTANLPAAGESLLKTAIAKLNAVPGFGADVVYGGRTTATKPTAAQRFVVVWGSGCTTAGALACTIDGSQGSYDYVFQGRVIVTAARYAANPSTTWWVGTLMHEIAHASGLGHFDGTYLGSYQLMRWANGPNTLRPGDVTGLRRIAPPGRLSGSVRAVRNGAAYDLVVRAANAGLGGLRSIRTDCTDATGVYRAVRTATGKWDTVAADRTVGSVTVPAGATRRCRAVIRSKAASYTTPAVTLTG